ncbi:MAG: hypothetical protein V1932_01455 [Chloroflexota bacterium]
MENIIQRLNEFLGGPKGLLSLCIEGMSLKLLACRGERVVAWAITPINPRFLRGGFAVNSQGLASVIRAAVSKEEFSGQHRVLASLPAFHSVFRTLEIPNLKEVRPEVVIPQQARRDMGYSAENTLLFWHPLESGVDRRRFFVVSVPREPVLTLVETLRLAGLRPDKIETTTFALSRAVNQSQAIIVAVEPNSLDSIIMRDNIPLATRSTFLGERPQEPEALPALVTDALERIIAFYDESNPDNPLPPDIPVCLFGSALSLNPDIVPAVESALGRPVAEFEPPILYPPDFPKAELAVNVGLVLKEL